MIAFSKDKSNINAFVDKMALTLIFSIVTFVALICSIIFLPKIKVGKFYISTYWLVALFGAILMLALVRVSFKEVGEALFDNESSMNPIKILVLFFSMTFISIFLEEAGFFRFLASYAAKKAGSKQITLFVIFYFLTALLTVVTSNDIVILTFTPFICYFCKHAKIKPLPYLIAEFAAANTWSMMLIIGNPTNMYLGANAGIDFGSYFKVMALPTLVSGAVEFGIIYLLFRKSLKAEMTSSSETIPVDNKLDVIFGLIHLGICIILLALSNVIGFDMWLISVCVTGSLLIYFFITRIIRKTLQKSSILIGKSLPWALIPFVISMFIIVISMQKQGISNELSKLLGHLHTVWTYGPASFVAANLINNIPMSILFSTLPTFNGAEHLRAIYASIIGSNIGAFLTPIGALAGIMFTGLLKDHDVKLSFAQFSLNGVIIAIPTFLVALTMLFVII